MIERVFVFIVAAWLLTSCGSDMVVTSPDGKNVMHLELDEDGALFYTMEVHGIRAVEKSAMGAVFADERMNFTAGLEHAGTVKSIIDETYTLPTGKTSVYINKARETVFTFRNRSGRTIDVVCRAYNDGMAFRYVYRNNGAVTVNEEITTICLPPGTMSWMMNYVPHYENFYPARLLDTVGNGALSWPALMHVDDSLWILLTEASVYDQPGTHFGKAGKGNELKIVYPDQEFTVDSVWSSPWRTFIAGTGLAKIVESVLVENLNPPSVISDMSWIRPGVAVFPWWGNFLANSYMDSLKMYVDLAAEMGWEWIEFDVSLVGTPFHTSKEWETTTWLPEFTAYAGSKGINVYGWDEISILDSREGRDHVYGRYKELGIKGIKIDFIESDSQHAMKFRSTATADAASRKLMVSFHGETVPRGQRRTFPNIMTLEGVRGAEYYALKGYAPPTPVHNCTLPFTRNVVGPMDYTPVTFTVRNENPRQTTYAHELALSVIVESGWLCMADRPEAYLNSPARPFLEKIESAWDETKFILGYPGEYVCLARRKGDRWFIAGINAGQEKTLEIPLSFAGEGEFKCHVYEDAVVDPLKNIRIRELDCSAEEKLIVNVASNGGFAALLE